MKLTIKSKLYQLNKYSGMEVWYKIIKPNPLPVLKRHRENMPSFISDHNGVITKIWYANGEIKEYSITSSRV